MTENIIKGNLKDLSDNPINIGLFQAMDIKPIRRIYRIVRDGNGYFRLQWDVDVGAVAGQRLWTWEEWEFTTLEAAEAKYNEIRKNWLSKEVVEIVKELS